MWIVGVFHRNPEQNKEVLDFVLSELDRLGEDMTLESALALA